MDRVHDLVTKRAAVLDEITALDKPQLTVEERATLAAKNTEFDDLTDQIARAKDAQKRAALTAQPVAGQALAVPAKPETDVYINEGAAQAKGLRTNKGLTAIAIAKTFHFGGGSIASARELSVASFGERHPVSETFQRALVTSIGASGGFIVPPDYVNEIIELLRPRAVVRSSNPRTMPMPRGTMTMPGQASAATAGYGAEVAKITQSQQTLRQVVASYKKLTALVPVTNDMMRYADPAADAFVRDDLVKVTALREDLAFILGDGTQDTPRGFLSFANGWVAAQGGTAGSWSTSANSTLAVNAADPANTTGGNFITANETYTLATVAAELGGAVNRLDTANVPDDRRVWFMNPRSFNYLYNVQNSLGVYVYRDELTKGTLFGYPVRKSTQIGTNYYDATGSHTDCSFIFLVEMDEAVLLDSMTLEMAVSREGTYVDSSGATVSAFQSDQTIVRAIAEHDFQMRHDQSIAVIQNVRCAPAIS